MRRPYVPILLALAAAGTARAAPPLITDDTGSLHYRVFPALKLVADYSVENTLDPGPSGSVRYSTMGAVWAFAPTAGIGCGVKLGHGEFAIDRTYLCGLGVRLN
jgi:hypothetical protein